MAAFERFAGTGGGLSEHYGLLPAQRQFFLERNKNLMEQMRHFYGGRPLSVEDYFAGLNNVLSEEWP